MLEKPFSLGDVEFALTSCDGNKSPGPDGFTMQFIQSKWEFMKDNFRPSSMILIKNGTIFEGINFSFIVLIPKKKNNSAPSSDYRPISLIGSVYKLLAKSWPLDSKGSFLL